jgi:hypothetical protein
MNDVRSEVCAQALTDWLSARIGGDARVFYRGPMRPAGGGDAGHHFCVSVPVADTDSLFRLRSLTGPILSSKVDAHVVLVVPVAAIETKGSRSWREVTVHVKAGS